MQVSPNFAFLKAYDLQLVRLCAQAEQYFANDPVTCLMKLRQFGELLAQLVAAKAGLYEEPGENQLKLLQRLDRERAISGEALDLFHQLRKDGNRASHQLAGEHRTALSNLKYARILGIWFHRSYGGRANYKAGPFAPPADPEQETEALRSELAQLKAEATAYRDNAQTAKEAAAEEAELRQIAEALLIEAEAKAEEVQAKLAAVQAESVSRPRAEIQETIEVAQRTGERLDLDERETRRLIDEQLRAAGWEADTEEIRYSKGVRPQKGSYLAIAEWPTESGPADYALFAGLQAIGVVEAKRKSTDVSGDIIQSKRYSRGFILHGDADLIGGSPWGDYRVPFVFATNGRDFLEQLRTKSGI